MINTCQEPTFATAPGETLLETIDALGMNQVELAQRTGLSKKTINLIIKGNEPITQETALALEKVLRVPAHFWLTLDSRYREQLAREQDCLRMDQFCDWARSFPYVEMARRDFVPPARDASAKAACLLSYFGVSHPDRWKSLYAEMNLELSYRKTPKACEKLPALSAWLRKGELLAETVETQAFDEDLFRANLAEIREMTVLGPKEFAPRIQILCAQAGVVYVLVPELAGLGISGVMQWYHGRPLIQQSLLFKSNDHFWFTFFHEAKHVLQKRKKDIFLEGQNASHEDQKREEEANRFSGDLLIPPAEWERFIHDATVINSSLIRAFAKRISIHPGIVVGRLMREDVLDYSHPAQNLRAKFVWA